MKSWLLKAIGGLCFGLGVAGAFLPVLPTTPFMLLALWAFSSSSERWHSYIYDHPRFGRTAREWREHRAIPMRVKITAILAMALSSAYLISTAASPYTVVPCVSVMLFGACYILTRPTLKQSPSSDDGRALSD